MTGSDRVPPPSVFHVYVDVGVDKPVNTAITTVERGRRDDVPAIDLSPAEAVERLRRGEAIRDVRIARLRLKGEFPLPVRM